MASPYIYSNSGTSARKILLSLMSHPYYQDTVKKSNTTTEEIDLNSPNTPIQLEILNFKNYGNKLEKIEKMIQANKNEIRELQILVQEKHKADNSMYEEEQKIQFYSMLGEWLLKQVYICVNGLNIQGVLTQISRHCLTLVASESIYIIPLNRIDFVKLNV